MLIVELRSTFLENVSGSYFPFYSAVAVAIQFCFSVEHGGFLTSTLQLWKKKKNLSNNFVLGVLSEFHDKIHEHFLKKSIILAKNLGTWLLRAYRLIVEFGIAFAKPQTSISDEVVFQTLN